MAKSSTAAAAKARASSKVRAQSIHLGLNGVDPKHYGGWSGELCACEFDANDMAALARAAGMTTTVLLTKNATRTKALAAVRAAAKQLKSGDLLLLTYSGHRALPAAQRDGLLNCIAGLIDQNHGRVVKRYLTELRIARRLG